MVLLSWLLNQIGISLVSPVWHHCWIRVYKPCLYTTITLFFKFLPIYYFKHLEQFGFNLQLLSFYSINFRRYAKQDVAVITQYLIFESYIIV